MLEVTLIGVKYYRVLGQSVRLEMTHQDLTGLVEHERVGL